MVKRLFAKRSVPGWILIGWGILNHASTAQFTLQAMGAIFAFLDKHAGYAVLLGFGWLVFESQWPKIKGWFPQLRLPKTMEERTTDVERRLVQVESTLPELSREQQQRTLHEQIDDRLGRLETGIA